MTNLNPMNIKEIENLIKFVQKSGVCEVSIEQKDFKITIKTQNQKELNGTYAAVPAPQAIPIQHMAAPVVDAAVHTPAATAPAVNATDDSKYITIKSPMIGTFYRTPSPDKPVFVNIGDEIKPGKVLCIIEAMKLFNEIESEVSGKIVKVLIDNSTPVEYDQPLFLVDPS